MKTGRPRKITNHIARKIFLLAGYGLTDVQLADVFDINPDTIAEVKKNAEFSESLKRSKDKADLAVVNSLYKRAIGYEYEEEYANKDGAVMCKKVMHPDVTACIFWLKNRQRADWRDKEAPVIDQSTHYHLTAVQKVHQAMKNRITPILESGLVEKNGLNGNATNGNGHRPADSFRVD